MTVIKLQVHSHSSYRPNADHERVRLSLFGLCQPFVSIFLVLNIATFPGVSPTDLCGVSDDRHQPSYLFGQLTVQHHKQSAGFPITLKSFACMDLQKPLS